MTFTSLHCLNIFSDQKEKTIAAPLGALLFSLNELLDKNEHVFVVVEESIQVEKIYESLCSLYDNVLYFPSIELMPYSHGMPSLDILAARIKVLSLLYKNEKPYIIVCCFKSFIRYLPPVEAFERSLIELKEGITLNIEQFSEKLKLYGYTQVSLVREVGEFAVKNRLIDIFPSDSDIPIRIIVEDDCIAKIACFNKDTQLSEKKITKTDIVPLAEFVFPKDKEGFPDPFQNTLAHSTFIEYYHKLSSLTSYAESRNTNILFTDRPELQENKIRIIFSRLKADKLLIPSIREASKSALRIYFRDNNGEEFPNIRQRGNFSGGFSGFVIEVEKLIAEKPNTCICFFSEYPENARRIAVMLRRFKPKIIKNINDVPENQPGFYIITKNWEFGFSAEDQSGDYPILLIGETNISGKQKAFRKRLSQTSYSNFSSDIQTGDYVVHLNYGIGVFRGIERISSLDKEKDYIHIEYADKQKLFVPLEQADLIGRYKGSSEDKQPKLDSLTGKSWQKKKVKAQEDILRLAKQLVEDHAKRLTLEGTAFPPDTEAQKAFEDLFPYIETPDQIKALEEIKIDMENPRPMDRLLCGDVGFGKTEIALRAAFKAIFSGKQAAFLAPTTILAEQHYLTSLERFKEFPVKIALLTRFTTPENKKEILKQLAEQKLDLIIGTHALLSKSIQFKDLGLLIIDEEHKFGVEQKEKIKSSYNLTDILSLSATPIPRTLSLALGNLRSFSTIQTPPELRMPIETICSDFNTDIIKDALRTELERGGQVYFIHNRIKELDKYAELISELVPEASIITAHGQMEEDELENAFLGFMKGFYNILIATTIVESGLDIPNANTLIVSDAHRLGLAQLYQLKGRVGRSNKQAYAYFLFPEHKNITETAVKRLDALAEYTELGSGFEIAKQDMEIRGAGNILGAEQHGHVITIGYDMYMKLLREEVDKLQGNSTSSSETLVDLSYNAFIPDTYISDPALKMEAYKKIVAVKTEEETETLKKELNDRYGSIPHEAATLFEISKLKIEAGKIGITSITEKSFHIEIVFSQQSKADPFKILEIAQNCKHPVSFNPYNPHQLNYDTFEANAEQKVRRLTSFLRDIC
ncbi:MAG: transcription-repair coupling factor [Brevinemataceae bacterium]